ncbi:MAG: glutathione S-transferase C-terminal domain-containing protein [Cyanobacteria bacterium J06598_4]
MITLYAFGSSFNLPDPSPYVMKTEILLKMAKLPYEKDTAGDVTKAPKGKFPYIVDDGKTIADSSLIRFYLEQEYKLDFDSQADPAALPSAFMAEKYCEDNLYFLLLSQRWLNQDNFEKGPKVYFERVPRLLRGFVSKKVIKDVKQTLWLQGLGRHTLAEKIQLVEQGSDMLARLLSDRQFFGGNAPCGADAFIASILCGILNDFFDCPYQEYFAEKENLVEYTKRMMQLFYPDYQPNFSSGKVMQAL